MSFYDKVYDCVRKIPEGNVATYGQIAVLCGSPRASRAVGYALHFNPEPGVIPCHRVVNRFGGLAPAFAFGGQKIQRQLLDNTIICRRCTAAAEYRAYSRGKLTRAERLGHIVISTHIKRFDFFALFGAGGNDNDRHIRPLPYIRYDFGAVRIGETDVQKHHIGQMTRNKAASLFACFGAEVRKIIFF